MSIDDDFFYPHKLLILVGSSYVEQSICRDQPNTGGDTTLTSQRTEYVYQSLIFLPKSNLMLKPGQKIKVIGDNGETRLNEVSIVRFSSDGLEDNRIWV